MCQKNFKNKKVLPSLLWLRTHLKNVYIIINALTRPYYIVGIQKCSLWANFLRGINKHNISENLSELIIFILHYSLIVRIILLNVVYYLCMYNQTIQKKITHSDIYFFVVSFGVCVDKCLNNIIMGQPTRNCIHTTILHNV